MNLTELLLIFVFIIGASALCIFICTKAKGFGKYTTSVFLIILVTIFMAMLTTAGIIEPKSWSDIVFAIIGFAGGLFTSKDSSNEKEEIHIISKVVIQKNDLSDSKSQDETHE